MREGGVDEKARQERLEKMRLIEAALRNHPGWEITFGEGMFIHYTLKKCLVLPARGLATKELMSYLSVHLILFFNSGSGFTIDPKTGEKRFTAHQPKINTHK